MYNCAATKLRINIQLGPNYAVLLQLNAYGTVLKANLKLVHKMYMTSLQHSNLSNKLI